MSDIYAVDITRDESEATRLDEQFDLMNMNVGYLVRPEILAALPAGARVADVGTGTGLFLRRFHELQAFPGAVLDGYDISSIMFPATTPGNMSFAELDIKKPIPQELLGKYNLVHASMLIVVIRPSEWTSVVANVAQLLKPGGWLQWLECDFSGGNYLRSRVDSRVEAARRPYYMFEAALGERVKNGWHNLPGDMETAGLKSIIRDCVSTDRLPETRKRLTITSTKLAFAWIRHTHAMADQELTRMKSEAYADIKSGCYHRFDLHVVCGQKPLDAA